MRVSFAGVITTAGSSMTFALLFAGLVFLAAVILAATIYMVFRPIGGYRRTFSTRSRNAYLRARDRSRTGNSPSGESGGDTPPGGYS